MATIQALEAKNTVWPDDSTAQGHIRPSFFCTIGFTMATNIIGQSTTLHSSERLRAPFTETAHHQYGHPQGLESNNGGERCQCDSPKSSPTDPMTSGDGWHHSVQQTPSVQDVHHQNDARPSNEHTVSLAPSDMQHLQMHTSFIHVEY